MTAKRLNACEVAVIGAGPYGLSVAAHLRHAGVSTRVFGEPMSFWRQHMPKGMRLRSPWRASHLSDPAGARSLDAYAGDRVDRTAPLPLESFVAYGRWFQEHAVGDVDRRMVRRVAPSGDGFQLELTDGDVFTAGRVVVATGLAHQDYRPRAFHGLPAALVSHSCAHSDFAELRGKHVAVIGRGQSACESAALLAEAGAEVDLISRGAIRWLGAATADAIAPKNALENAVKNAVWQLREALAAPSAVGPFPLSWLVELPALVRHLPPAARGQFTTRCLKAAAAGWLKQRCDDVRCDAGRTIVGAHVADDRIVLALDNGTRSFDHVILGTGYRVDVTRLGIFSPPLLDAITCADGSPILQSGLESSVPRLHFVGSYAVQSFGPLLRFVAGAPYAARAVTDAVLKRGAQRRALRQASVAAATQPDGLLQ
jgi:cation diffusion facilitator CzcD-associated flavoprotein CzcO